MYIELQNPGGNDIATGFTPVTFSLTPSTQYLVYANNYEQIQFVCWGGLSTSSNTLNYTASSGSQDLVAIYASSGGSSACNSTTSSSTSTTTTTSTTSSSSCGGSSCALTVLSENATGDTITGYYTALSSSSGSLITDSFTPASFTLTNGVGYEIQADSYGVCTFSHWEGGGLSGSTTDPAPISITSPTTIEAVYSGSDCGLQTTNSTSTASAAGGASAPMGLIVPMYMDPDSYWTELITAKEAYPSVPVIAIINPENGPGPSSDSTYASYTANLASAGIIIAGYIDTVEMSTSISSVESQMQEYVAWYPQVSVFFLDDMPDTYSSSFASYYSTLTAYANSLGKTTIANPGWEVSASAYATTDGIMFYESSGLPSLSYLQGADFGDSASHFSFIATSVSSLPDQSYFDSAAQYAAYTYISNQGDSYSNLPTYLMQEMAELAATA